MYDDFLLFNEYKPFKLSRPSVISIYQLLSQLE